MQSTLNNSSASVGMDVFPPTASLSVTEAAVFKIWELVQEEGNVDLSLRVFISGGGCSGFEYGFSFDETVNEDDSVLTLPIEHQNSGANQVRVLVDPMSLQYLVGAEIDYQSDVQGEQFIIRNPNAKTTCGCGSSFSV